MQAPRAWRATRHAPAVTAVLVLGALTVAIVGLWLAEPHASRSANVDSTVEDAQRDPERPSAAFAPAGGDAWSASDAVVASSGAADGKDDGSTAPDDSSAVRRRIQRCDLRGKVLDHRGEPTIAIVHAVDSRGRGVGTSFTESDGGFLLSGVGVPPWTLNAEFMGELTRSDPVEVPDDLGEVLLRLKRPSSIFGMVVDAVSGEPRAAEYEYARCTAIAGQGHSASRTTKSGELLVRIGAAGTYALSARSPDGWGIVDGIEVPAHADVGPIRVELRPRAKLTIRYIGSARFLHCTVTCGAYPVTEMDFSRERGFTCEVPAQALRVQLSDLDWTWTQSHDVAPHPGEHLEVVFD